MQPPPGLIPNVHDYQLLGAAQGDYLYKSVFRGILCDDEMGVGKTLLAILVIWLARDGPGFSLVAAPASLCPQWVVQTAGVWREVGANRCYRFCPLLTDHTGPWLRAFHLTDPKITAMALLAGGYDVVVVSHKFLESTYRGMKELYSDMDEYRNEGKGRKPKRPTFALRSFMWDDIKVRIKRLLIDEQQFVNKRDGIKHW